MEAPACVVPWVVRESGAQDELCQRQCLAVALGQGSQPNAGHSLGEMRVRRTSRKASESRDALALARIGTRLSTSRAAAKAWLTRTSRVRRLARVTSRSGRAAKRPRCCFASIVPG